MGESLNHWRAKGALTKILLLDDYSLVQDEFALETINTVVGERDYIIDLFAEKEGKRYAFELDGWKGHSTKRDFYKMKIRDESLLKLGIRTIRIPVRDVVGRKKQPLNIILSEIEYQKQKKRS